MTSLAPVVRLATGVLPIDVTVTAGRGVEMVHETSLDGVGGGGDGAPCERAADCHGDDVGILSELFTGLARHVGCSVG